ncbi:MAG: phage portal protein [Kiritimatiellae bacterium]|nr:phage portal protein [Kiritimatiellia bacterium]
MVTVGDLKAKKKPGRRGQSVNVHTPFTALPAHVKRRVATRLVGGLRSSGFFNRGGYRTVWGEDQINRRWTSAETGDELQQLTASERNRLIALARNTARNSEHMEGILTQLANNIIGAEGGKAIFTFPEKFENQKKIIHRAFAQWCQEAEYFDDQSLQDLLRILLRTLYIGGDLVVVFDARITSRDSGQIITFEPDCMGNINDAEFNRLFPGYSQHQGIIKDENGKTIGCIVSWSQRGQSEFRTHDDKGRLSIWALTKKPGDGWNDSPFTMMRNFHRINQIRGSSPLWSGLGTISDGADLQGYEVQASKRNAQIIGQVTQGESETDTAELSAELDPDAVAPIAVSESDDENVEPLQEEIVEKKLDIDAISSAGVIYDVMPENCKMELLDIKHPNTNLVEFSRWLHSGAAYAAGLTSLFATGKAEGSYSAAMAEMILAQTQFRVEFQRLERHFLDWALANWSRRAQARGLIPQDSELPEDWRRTCVKWQRPQERALNPVDEQNAIALGLKNLTRNYHETLGADWRQKLLEIAEELNFTRENNIPDPRLQTVSGGIIESTPQNNNNQ